MLILNPQKLDQTSCDMKNFSEFFVESILDPEQLTLSPQIFELTDPPKLKDSIRTEILAGIAKIAKTSNVLDYTLIGSILTKRYAEDSDIDINILVNASEDDMDKIRSVAMEHSGRLVPNTKHPINYHVLADKSDFDNANKSADGVFDISKNAFIRKPIEKPFHIEKYFDSFKSVVSKIDVLKDELKDDLIDYTALKKFTKDDVKNLQKLIQNELDDIENTAKGLSDLHDKIVSSRNAGFAKDLTASEIREYGTKNRLPGNVIYKLLERHHYLRFLHEVDAILKDGKVSEKEADKLVDIVL